MTCTAPCTAPTPHTQKPAPHLHRRGCVLSPYNPLRCAQGCTASRRLAGTLYASWHQEPKLTPRPPARAFS
jgi:hypothetical protein